MRNVGAGEEKLPTNQFELIDVEEKRSNHVVWKIVSVIRTIFIVQKVGMVFKDVTHLVDVVLADVTS